MNVKPSTPVILGIKPGHDGAFALIEEGRLALCIEAEKDNGSRYAEIDAGSSLKLLQQLERIPDVLAYSGWSAGAGPGGTPIGAGYRGLGMAMKGRHFGSSHERSHLLCAYGLSPFEQGRPCHALLWEGHIGSFYFIDESLRIEKLADILPFPGIRYAFLFGLADRGFHFGPGQVRLGDAGKLMALCSYADHTPICAEGQELVRRILDPQLPLEALDKRLFSNSRFHNCGITHPDFAGVARLLSDRLYDYFEAQVRKLTTSRHPLLVSGGCGLNCDWNSRWMASGLFDEVFIPPCTNDSGSAIGTAIDAHWYMTGSAKVQWSPYAGEYPLDDVERVEGFDETPYTPSIVAQALAAEKILGWVKGRYEIGPRALGARSIFASAAPRNMLDRLNALKRRESFRPIAPLCRVENMQRYFFDPKPSPYMLEFRRVISAEIPAVTHVDGSARPQSVSFAENADVYRLLSTLENEQNIAVLCNTSLNFNGRGFLNRLSDVRDFALQQGLDGFVFNDRFFLKSC